MRRYKNTQGQLQCVIMGCSLITFKLFAFLSQSNNLVHEIRLLLSLWYEAYRDIDVF